MKHRNGRPPHAAGVFAAACLAAAWAGGACAAPAPGYDTLLQALDRAPVLREAEALRAAADARVRQAAARPNPELSVEIEAIDGSGPYAGGAARETTYAITQPLELWGQRRARVEAARSAAGAAGLRALDARWAAAARLALACAEAEAAARRDALAAEALSLAEADAATAARLVEAGREPRLRQVQALAAVEAARARHAEARAAREGAFARLAAVAGLDAPVTAVADDLLEREPLPARPTAAGEPLPVRIASAELAAARGGVDVARLRGLPQLGATVGRRRFREDAEAAWDVGLTLSLPLLDRNRGALDAARAESAAAEARLEDARRAALAEREAALAALRSAAARTAAADAGVAAADEAYRLGRAGFEAGRIAQLELRDARAALVAAREAAVDARLQRARAEIDLARLEGRAPFGATP
ncbi:TolC family protein [Luteimonas huabeiensis]|uniref:TolC family protein n=1 Tax=Luteimonas huabeiensis TaxID=1244513 RepID=UPI0004655ABF|nr:TolC family protein [Luteimonas huabeiensis]